MVSPGKYGSLAERYAAKKYGIDLDYPMIDGVRFDGSKNGRPVEIKAAASNRRGGSVKGTALFRVWKDEHELLERENGYMIFVEYTKRGNGIAVNRSRSVRARNMTISNWMARVGPRDERQAQIQPSQVF